MKKPVLVWKYEHLGEWQNGPAIDQWVSADSKMANREEKIEYKIRRKIEFCIDRFEKLSNKKKRCFVNRWAEKNKLASMIVEQYLGAKIRLEAI